MKAERKFLVVGAGGLGCPALLTLAWANVAHVTVVDPDVVEVSNLHRQPFHERKDVGRPKVESVRDKLSRFFPQLHVSALQLRVDKRNVTELVSAHDVVVDGTDGVETKFLLSDAAVHCGKISVYGGVVQLQGQVMRVVPGGPCLRCLFEVPPPENLMPSCSGAGVLGSMAGVIGGLQGALALKPVTDSERTMLYVVEGKKLSARAVWVTRRSDCETCGNSQAVQTYDMESDGMR